MLFVGDDWAEDHHDVEVQDEAGRRVGRARLPEGVAGVARLHELVGGHLAEDAGPEEVAVGIETDRGPWVQALLAAGPGPACWELCWYLALNRARLPEPKEAVLSRFRAALEERGIDTASWWQPQLDLCMIGIMATFGWEKALGDADELAW